MGRFYKLYSTLVRAAAGGAFDWSSDPNVHIQFCDLYPCIPAHLNWWTSGQQVSPGPAGLSWPCCQLGTVASRCSGNNAHPNPWRIPALLRSIWPKNVASKKALGLTRIRKGTILMQCVNLLRSEVVWKWQHIESRGIQLRLEKATVWHKTSENPWCEPVILDDWDRFWFDMNLIKASWRDNVNQFSL